MTPRSLCVVGGSSEWRRPIASRSRASTSAGPALSSSTSSMPHSAVRATRPPSVRIANIGEVTPVVRSRRHRRAGGHQVAAGVDQQGVVRRGLEQRGGLGRGDADRVRQQSQSRHDGGRRGESTSQHEQRGHGAPPRDSGRRRPRCRRDVIEVADEDNTLMPHLPSPFPHAGPPLPDAEELTLETSDGERLTALHVPRPAAKRRKAGSRAVCIVVAHGFTGSIDRPALRAVARGLSPYAGLLLFDFRGHGGSSGRSTLGDRRGARRRRGGRSRAAPRLPRRRDVRLVDGGVGRGPPGRR